MEVLTGAKSAAEMITADGHKEQGKCVPENVRRNAMDLAGKKTSQHIKESKANLRAGLGAKRKMESGGKNKVIDNRGKNMYNAAKGGKST